jgi:hypothetical protein
LSGISIGEDGAVYGVGQVADETFHLFTFNPTTATFEDQGATEIINAPVGTTGSLWAIASDNRVFMNGPNTWTRAPGSFQNNDLAMQVDVGNDGSVWVRCQSGAIYSYESSSQSWSPLAGVPQGLSLIAVVSTQLIYAQVGSGIQIYNNGSWSALAAPPYGLASEGISVGTDGTLWSLSTYGTVHRYSGGAWVRQIMPTDLSGQTGGHQVTEVVTGLHSDGNQYAFYVMDGSLWYCMLDTTKAFGGYWTEGTELLGQPCSNFGATVYAYDNALIVHGVTTSGSSSW